MTKNTVEYTYGHFREYVEDFTEADGFMLFNALKSRFNWAGTVFCREDVESMYRTIWDTDNDMSEKQWDIAQSDYAWRHMDDLLAETGNEIIRLIVEELPT